MGKGVRYRSLYSVNIRGRTVIIKAARRHAHTRWTASHDANTKQRGTVCARPKKTSNHKCPCNTLRAETEAPVGHVRVACRHTLGRRPHPSQLLRIHANYALEPPCLLVSAVLLAKRKRRVTYRRFKGTTAELDSNRQYVTRQVLKGAHSSIPPRASETQPISVSPPCAPSI